MPRFIVRAEVTYSTEVEAATEDAAFATYVEGKSISDVFSSADDVMWTVEPA